MTNNFKVNKSYLNFIHARNFFPEGEAEEAKSWLSGMRYQPQLNGRELPRMNLVFPDMEMIVGGMLGDWVKINPEDSGVFRFPYHNQVMFEPFESLNEWRMAIALEDNVFRIYNHVSGVIDAKDGIEGLDFNKPEDWTVETQLNLKQNDCVFYRPWVFYSLEEKLINHHKIIVQEDQ